MHATPANTCKLHTFCYMHLVTNQQHSITDHMDTYAHKSASIWSITSAKENIYKHSLCTYMHISFECRYIHADTTHTHTGAIKVCFMTLMNGLWILYPFRWDQKWGIAGCVEGHTHKHTYHLHINWQVQIFQRCTVPFMYCSGMHACRNV